MSTAVLTRPPESGSSLRELWLITIGHSLTHWYPATFYLLLPFLVKEMGLTYSQAGFLVTIRAAANLLIAVSFPESWPLFLAVFPMTSKLILFAVQFITVRHFTIRSVRARQAFAAQGGS